MTKLTADEKKALDDQVQQDDEDNYGSGHTDGDQEVFANTKDSLKKVIGNDPDPEQDGFFIKDEVEGDEKAIQAGADQQTNEVDDSDL